MSDYPAAAGVTRQNVLARLLGSADPIQQLPAQPMAPGPYATQGDPGFTPGIAPRMNLLARLLGEPLTTPQAERDAYRDALNAAGWAGSSAPGGSAVQGIRAFHGSPHRFDRFDMSRIGTGEGAQAYGHGLYFAQAEDTARTYRNAGRLPEIFIGDTPINSAQVSREARTAAGDLALAGDFRAARERISTLAPAFRESAARGLDELERLGARVGHGSMYEVNLRVDPQRVLNWEVPWEQQGAARDIVNGIARAPVGQETAGATLARAYRNQMHGGDLVGMDRADPAQITDALRRAGIQGIQYLDAGSRAAGQGTRNYVVFDDNLIDIVRRYGIAGLLAGGGGANILASQAQAAPQGGSP